MPKDNLFQDLLEIHDKISELPEGSNGYDELLKMQSDIEIEINEELKKAKNMEIRATDTDIEWRYVGDENWLNLISLSKLKGKDGIDGTNGINGIDGKEIELKKVRDYIQWKLKDDKWNKLILISELKGDRGDKGELGEKGDRGDKGDKGDIGEAGYNGAPGAQGPQGPQGDDGPNLVDTSTATTITGIIKGELGSIQQAVAGIDYVEPSYITDITTALSEPTGFEDRIYNDWLISGNVLTIGPTLVSYNIWFKGVKHTITGNKSITMANTDGLHYIYFDTDELLHEFVNPTEAQILSFIRDYVAVAVVCWDKGGSTVVYQGEERHGCIMDGITHYYLHKTQGLKYVSGLTLSSFVIGSGSLNSHAQFAVDSGMVADEDIGLTVNDIISTIGVPILYKLGAPFVWKTKTQAGYSCYQNPAGTTNRLMYNQLTAGAWQLTEVGEGNFVCYHLFMTTGKINQIYSIMGQAQYKTLPLAKAGANDEIISLVTSGLPSAEIKPLGTVLYQTDKDYTNAVRARIVQVGTGLNYMSWTSSIITPGVAPTSHSALSDLNTYDDHARYLCDSSFGTRTANYKTTGTFTMGGLNPLLQTGLLKHTTTTGVLTVIFDNSAGWDSNMYAHERTFRVYLNNVQTIGTGGWIKVLFDTDNWNKGANFDLANSKYVYKGKAEAYHNFSSRVKFARTHPPADAFANIRIMLNGNVWSYGSYSVMADGTGNEIGTRQVSVMITDRISLNENDEVWIEVYHEMGGDLDLEVGSEETYFSMESYQEK